MVVSEYSTDNYKSSKIGIRTIMKNSEMLKFVTNNLKTKKMCKHGIKRLSFIKRY